MKLVNNIKTITEWFTRCAAAVRHNPEDWVSPRELVDDFIALGFKHKGEAIDSFDPAERLKFQIALGKHLAFFADGRLFRAKSKPYANAPDGRTPSLPERAYQLSTFGEKIAGSGASLQRNYIGALFILNQTKSFIKR